MLHWDARVHRFLQGLMFIHSLGYIKDTQPQMYCNHSITLLTVHEHCLSILTPTAFNAFVPHLHKNNSIVLVGCVEGQFQDWLTTPPMTSNYSHALQTSQTCSFAKWCPMLHVWRLHLSHLTHTHAMVKSLFKTAFCIHPKFSAEKCFCLYVVRSHSIPSMELLDTECTEQHWESNALGNDKSLRNDWTSFGYLVD